MSDNRAGRMKRGYHEMIGDLLRAVEETPLPRNQIRELTKISGQHQDNLIIDLVDRGLIEWSGEKTAKWRKNSRLSEYYGMKLGATRKGKAWLRSWDYLLKLMKPNVRLAEPKEE